MQQQAFIEAAELRSFAEAVFEAAGLNAEDAATTAWALVEANLEGIDTHGISRLALYAHRVKAGLMAARPALVWSHPAPAVSLLDADNAPGPVAAVAAIDEAVRLAKIQGVGMVAVAHTNHAGAFSVYTERAAAQGCLAFMVGNTPPGVPPWGGKRAFLGTNPLAFTAPGPTPAEPPVVIDMATSVVARGHIIMAARQGQPIPDGWAIDADGHPTNDAHAALAGAVLPMAGAKGYALGLMIEILSSVLSGANWGPRVRSPYEDWSAPTDAGLWCLALNLEPLVPSETYALRLGGLLAALREEPPAPDQSIRVPGERRAELRTRRTQLGIPIDPATRTELGGLSAEFSVRSPGWR